MNCGLSKISLPSIHRNSAIDENNNNNNNIQENMSHMVNQSKMCVFFFSFVHCENHHALFFVLEMLLYLIYTILRGRGFYC